MKQKIIKFGLFFSVSACLLLLLFVFSKKEPVYATCSPTSLTGSPQAASYANGKVFITRGVTKLVTSFDVTTDTASTTNAVLAPHSMFSLTQNNLVKDDNMFLWMDDGSGEGYAVVNTITGQIVATSTNTNFNNSKDGIVVGDKYYQVARNNTNNLGVVSAVTTNTLYFRTVSANPEKILSNAAGTKLYVISSSLTSGKVTVVDATTDTVGATIPVGGILTNTSQGAILGNYLYVPNSNSNTVSIIDLTTEAVVATTTVGATPKYISTSGTKVYIASTGNNTVSVIDQSISVSAVQTSISLTNTPIFMMSVASNSKIYVSTGSFGIKVISPSTDTVTKTITGGIGAVNSATEAPNGKLYTVASASGIISVIDTVLDTNLSNCGDTAGADIVPPQLVSFTSTTANAVYANGSTINITATFNEALAVASTMTVSLNTGATVVLNSVSGMSLSGTYTVTPGQNTSDLTVSSIVSHLVKDADDNTTATYLVPASPNNIADTSNIIVDTTPPSNYSISIDPTSLTPTDFTDPVFTFSAIDSSGGITYALSLNGGGFSTTTSPFSATGIDSTVVNTLIIQACDVAANCSTYTSYFYPAIIIHPSAVTSSSTISVTFDIIEPSTSAFNLQIADAYLDGILTSITCEPVINGTSKTSTCTLVGGIPAPSDHSNDGTHTLVVSATSTASVLGRASQGFTIDTISPSITSVTTSVANGSYILGNSIPITIALDEPVVNGSQVTLTFDTGKTLTFTCATSTCTSLTATYVVGANEDTDDLTVSSLSGATLADVVGNASSSPMIPDGSNLGDLSTISIDTLPSSTLGMPDLTTATDSGISTTDNFTGVDNVELTGVCIDGDTVELFKDGVLDQTVVCTSSAYSFFSLLPTEGSYDFKVRAIDPQNNTSSFSASLVVTYDISAPTLSSLTSTTADGRYSSGSNINITATFSEQISTGSTMSVTLDTGDVIVLSNISGNTLTGTYSVSEEDSSLDLTVISIVSVNVTNLALNTATTYALPVAPNNIADSSQIVIFINTSSRSGGSRPKNNNPVPATLPVNFVSSSTNPMPQNPNNFGLNPVACENYIKSYIRLGANNDVEDVKKLETFLNTYEGMKLPVDGVFSKADEDAVRIFQERYTEVLSFWNLLKPTGYVYISTQKAINRIYCEKTHNMTCPYFFDFAKQGDQGVGVTKIKAFLNNTQNEKLSLTDKFDTETTQAVIRFQSKFKDRVLTPWKLAQPTGLWYQSTRKKANDVIGCFAPQRLDNGVILD